MMHMYLVLLATFAVIHINQAQCNCCDPNPTPNYSRMLRGIPSEARRAFRDILRKDYVLSRNEVTSKMFEWAKQYNMTSELQAILKQNAETAQEVQTTISTVIQQLPDFMTKLNAISQNMSLSSDQVKKNIEQLKKSVSPHLRDAGCFIVGNANQPSYYNYNDYNFDASIGFNVYDGEYRRKRSSGNLLHSHSTDKTIL